MVKTNHVTSPPSSPNVIIEQTKEYVHRTLANESSGHDWWHVYRVYTLACRIGEKENGNSYIIALAALLHDIADWKFHDGDDNAGPTRAREWLTSLDVDTATIDAVCLIIKNMSFKGANVPPAPLSWEGKIVQDADRLDAIGAIGIARTFAYGGYMERPMHDPDTTPHLHSSASAYKHNKGTTINHFYEKLLLLKDRLHTDMAKKIAQKRHRFMHIYLDQFFAEWNSTD